MLMKDDLQATSTCNPSRPTGNVAEVKSERGRLARMLRVEWLGQAIASLCWIVSVMCYGITSTGDWLQLAAASAWLFANIAAVMTSETGQQDALARNV